MVRRTKDKQNDPQPLDLVGFREVPEDQGLSLDELSGSLAQLLGDGSDPYQVAEVEHPASTSDNGASQTPTPTPTNGDDGCAVSPRSILEAMLFVGHPANEPLTSKAVAALMRGVRASEVDQLVEELNELYLEEDCPYHIQAVGAGYRLTVKDEYQAIRERFYGKIREAKLSQAAVDVLAVVAYRQPIGRKAVDEIRKDASGRLLNQLVRRQLLAVERTTEKPRLSLYRTTGRFLELFGLDSLDELPQSQDFDRR